ncbi:alanine--tRNA ligase [Parabacteroides distasonis str. 3776 D15 iv]|jgi:alanyl-tRNA synthetase|uniref:Alanine--tRNA ligase n=1 Tax=Parabacteroides distasonis str. 3776 D15 i TaxID=1339342 RepID=A0AB34L7U1_PARDI|nr:MULTISPECIES: alanine--tRNA ligase [Parabacteroides]KDS36892.1 alanine--tRNA ligase [Parabacteroides distasonis str. 3776 D15 i]KDS46350.1 alanine--tRNA ligase [Parabacteroides distasonis str. 3776 Po2 i]KDS67056.1 alanine--tRNA ligase [Parabacteroides distasonis str. 3776 D15 iv]RLT69499.1 alanine--tRNA ligase [Parabacteroides sp. CH2-D42-20]
MLTAKEIRESFKQFFASKEHQIVPSAPMVVKGDPTLMFTNAGMNQFKDIILGNVPRKYPRVADSQKCLRVSGKHNDLEEVGHDTYHHTMFEMLGNWSFGDYFKKEAINWAWEYLVEVLKLNPERLYATVFEGSPAEGLDRDNEAAGYWEQYLPKDHILNGNKHDNFWEMGDTGPCGPCSEIHIDLRSDEERAAVSGADMVNKDHPQVIEIWNLVFMQFNRKADGSLEPLPAKVIDTGMGFERLCMALQGKTSNYDTDVFQPIIKVIAGMAGTTYGTDKQQDIAMRVIADHIRTIAFAITDGQLPSNAKAGYVIRRILRRAVRYGYTFLDRKEAFMYKLLPVLIETMGDAYPELIAQKTLIEKVIKEEEESFLRTLETGIRLLDKKMEETKAAGKTVLNGVDAFTLYDTYGFPLDLTELILRENGMEADIEEFNKAMQKQKERARNAAAIETGDWITLKEGECKFVGYDLFECEAEILRYRQIKQKNKVLYQIVLDQTPFYAEMGGQVGDTGWLIADDEKIDVIDTKRENNLPVHLVAKLPKDVTATFTAKINEKKRIQCECNHSATHLLHEALREVLGTHVEQKGSYVSPDSLRFDFSHFQKVTDEEIRKVEILVGEKIRANFPLEEHRNMPIAEAKALGAMALFGEKYGDEVRVVKYGSSVELCGGTHIPATGMIGSLHVIGESSIAAGVRRIEAVTAEGAEQFVYAQQDLIRELRALMNHMPNLAQAMKKSIEENAEMKKQIEDYIREKSMRLKEEIVAKASESNGIKVMQFVGKANADAMKNVAFQIKAETTDSFVFVAGIIDDNKCTLMLMLSDDLVKEGLHAGKIVKEAAKHIQGGGGGQPHFATAGGKNMEGLSIAVGAVKEAVGVQ